MDRINIKDTDLKLSRLGLGCVKAGVKWDGQEAFDLMRSWIWVEMYMIQPGYILTGFLLRKDAAKGYWDSGWRTVGNAMMLFW